MAELNDKLITYGNLSTFYDKLQEQGLGGNAIEDASVLPDASENKNKLIRLESDDNVYVSELKSRTSTTTNRLPDAQQIDKAYLYFTDGAPAVHYKGLYNIVCTDGETTAYLWASEFNYVFSLVNAVHITENDVIAVESIDDWNIESGNTLSTEWYTLNDFNERFSMSIIDSGQFVLIPATYNAPESAQIGNAYLNYNTGEDVPYWYTGIQKTIVCSDGSINAYEWVDNIGNGVFLFTEKQASDLYLYNDTNESTFCADFKVGYIDLGDGWEVSGNTYTNLYMTSEDVWYDVNDLDINLIYIPQLNAPDSEQVDNAYLVEDYYGGFHFVYTGEETTIEIEGVNTNVYIWETEDSGNTFTIYSTKPAYQIYNTDRDSDDVHFYDEDVVEELTFVGEELLEISTVKYQRTEVTEEWGWQPLTDNATNDDIDLMFAAPTGNKFYLLKASDTYGAVQNEAFVHTSGDTVDYNGQTCYRWYKQEDDEGSLSSDAYWDDNDMYMLTNTLNIHLPFNKYSDEFVAIISNDSPTSYLASFGEENFIEMIIE